MSRYLDNYLDDCAGTGAGGQALAEFAVLVVARKRLGRVAPPSVAGRERPTSP